MLERTDLLLDESMNIESQGTRNTHGIILFRRFSERQEVICPEINSADESDSPVDGDDFSMQAAKHIETQSEQSRTRIEYVQSHAGGGESIDEPIGQIRRTIVVHGQIDTDTSS